MQSALFAEEAAPQMETAPAIVRQCEMKAEYKDGFRPLMVLRDEWVETRVTMKDFAIARRQYGPDVSDDYIMLGMLEVAGVRVNPCNDTKIRELYAYVDGPFIIRKRTIPGFAIVCWQLPAKQGDKKE